jgi:hypothetical protein
MSGKIFVCPQKFCDLPVPVYYVCIEFPNLLILLTMVRTKAKIIYQFLQMTEV